jgi:hypothetical protein
MANVLQLQSLGEELSAHPCSSIVTSYKGTC